MREERLKHVAEIRISNVDKKSADSDPEIRLCNYTDVYYNERITGALEFMTATATAQQCATFGLRRGDVVLTKDSETADDIGVSALVADDVPNLVCGYHLAVVRARTGDALGGYLRWVLASRLARQRMSAAATGVTRFGLRSEAIADLPVPVPPIATQRAIADHLDRETARIDALIAAKRRMVELLEERWQGLLDTTMDQLCDAAGSQPIQTLCCMVVDCVNRTAPLADSPTPFRMIRTSNIRGGVVDLSDTNFVEREVFQRWNRRATPRRGDIVLTREAPAGEIGLLDTDDPVFLGQRLMLFRPDDQRSDSDFATFSLLTTRAKDQIGLMAAGSLHEHLRVREAARIQVPSPARDTQRQIGKSLRVSFVRKVKACNHLTRSVDLLEERRQALVTAAVTGQLDVVDVEAA